MANIFISHSSRNSDRAIEVRKWLDDNGWTDVFLDLDPERGIVAGQRWKEALQQAANRCELVLALVSPEWLASSWCKSEIDAARLMGKKIIVALIGVDKKLVPLDLSDEQWIDLDNDPAAYVRLKEGLKRAGLDPSSFPLEPGRRPYPGFAFLEEKDAALFFGRDAQIVRGLDKLRGLARTGVERMLVILGASGSGKSSFLRAGLWPRLKRDDRSWLPLPVIRPERAAISGDFGLAKALLQTMTQPLFADRIRQLGLPRSRADIQEFIEKTDDGLLRIFAALRDIAQVPGLSGETVPPPTIVIAIDQGEELFNEEGRDEARRLIAILARTLNADRRVLALMAMRSDAFPQLQSEPSLAEINKDTFTLDMMLEGSYRDVIVQPARLVTPNPLKIDPQLVDALLEDTSGQDALPLLAFTLAHLYDHYVADNELTLAGYEKLGRLNGVIQTTVEDALAEGAAGGDRVKNREAQLALARAAFIPHLAQINAAGQFIRRVATRDEIPPEARPLIDRFAERRLLIRDRRKIAGVEAEVIEVAHETLLRQPPFSEWLAEDREFMIWRERIAQARTGWEARQRDLMQDRELQFARDWSQRRAKDIAPLDRKFIDDSIAADDKRRADDAERERVQKATELEARQARKLRRAVIAASLFAVIAIGGWYFAYSQSKVIEQGAILEKFRHIAEQSMTETEQGDAGTGLLLALEALPDHSSEDSAVKSRQFLPAAAISLERAQRTLLEKKVLRGHQGPVTAVAAIPGGNRIVSASDDGTARIWDVESGLEVAALNVADPRPVTALAVMSGPPRIVTGYGNGDVRLWDAETGTEITAFVGGSRAITALTVISEPWRIIGFSSDRKGHIWNVLTRAEQVFDSLDVVTNAAVANERSLLVTATSNTNYARVWDIEAPRFSEAPKYWDLRGHDRPITTVAVTRDGNRFITGSRDKTVRIWDADTRETTKVLEHPEEVTDVTITPDGRYIVSSSVDGAVSSSKVGTSYIWDAESGARLRQIGGHQSAVNAVAVTSDGNHIVTGSSDWTMRIWELRPRVELAQFKGHTGFVTAVAAVPGSARVVTASSDRTARIWDSKTGVLQAMLRRHTGAIRAVAVSPGGTQVVTASEDNTARVWDAKSGVLRQTIVHPDDVTSVAVMRDGSRIVTGSRDKIARVWDIERPATAIEIKGHQEAITAVAAMSDGRIVTGSSDKTARIWKPTASSYEEAMRLKGHQLAITAVAVLDDNHVVTGSFDNTARVWDVRTGQAVAVLEGHQAAVTAVAVTPDSTAIITGSRDGNVRIWDAATHDKVAEFKAHDLFVTAIAVVPTDDGPRIFTGSSDRTARLWHLLPVGQALIDQAKASVVRCLSPAQRAHYFLPPTRPRWCGSGEKYPYDSVSALIEGRRLLVGGKVDEAQTLFKAQLGRNSDGAVNQAWAGAYLESGRNHLKAQRDDDAGAMFAEALKRDPSANAHIDAEWVDAYMARGRALLRAGQDNEATARFADAVKRDPSASGRVETEWATIYFVRGNDFLSAGKVDDAERVFAESLKHDPSKASSVDIAWVAAFTLRGSKSLLAGKNAEADAAFAEALRRGPSLQADTNTKWANAYIERGRNLLRELNDEGAKDVFAQALQRDPSADARIKTAWADAFVDRGKKSLSQDNDEAANAAFDDALRFDGSVAPRITSEWTAAYIGRGVKQIEAGNDDAARSIFAEAIKRDSSIAKRAEEAWAEGCIKRGVILVGEGNYDDAMTSFGKAGLHDPSARRQIEEALVDAYIARGKDLARNGKDDDANVAFAKASERSSSAKKRVAEERKRLSEELVVAALARGAELMEAGKVEEANRSFAGALRLDPTAGQRVNSAWGTAYNELAWKAFLELPSDQLGESLPKAEAALNLVQKALDLAPDNAFALDTRGSIFRAMGRIDEALADFDAAIRNGIKAPSTYRERGRCHEQKGNIDFAIADYQRAVELPAENDYARSSQAQAKERLAELKDGAKGSNPTIGKATQ